MEIMINFADMDKINDIPLMIDDRHELLNLYKSQCARCKHLNHYACKAFPVEIPRSLLSGEMNHDEVLPDQAGETTFEEEEPIEF